MKKKVLKILKVILIGVLIYVTGLAIEIFCLYAVFGDKTWNMLIEAWEWYYETFFRFSVIG